MAVVDRPFGKDKVGGSHGASAGYIEEALAGGHGPSEGMVSTKVDRPGQSILTAVAMDNVKLACDIETSILEKGGVAGDDENLKHSLTGVSAVQEDVGEA